ncbi:MAG TPA: hypothetical protein VLF67_01880 [Candidatus Saccharimonas sp.]|nr:hypothetical protein [Candidatus Saccharimonas sp.]
MKIQATITLLAPSWSYPRIDELFANLRSLFRRVAFAVDETNIVVIEVTGPDPFAAAPDGPLSLRQVLSDVIAYRLSGIPRKVEFKTVEEAVPTA